MNGAPGTPPPLIVASDPPPGVPDWTPITRCRKGTLASKWGPYSTPIDTFEPRMGDAAGPGSMGMAEAEFLPNAAGATKWPIVS